MVCLDRDVANKSGTLFTANMEALCAEWRRVWLPGDGVKTTVIMGHNRRRRFFFFFFFNSFDVNASGYGLFLARYCALVAHVVG